MPAVRITEKKRIDIQKGCPRNPVYIRWLGPLGGRNYWLFQKNQQVELVVGSLGTFDSYTEDIQNSQGTSHSIGKTANRKLTVGAYLPVSKLEAISTLLYSPNVVMLVNPNTWANDGGPKWKTIEPDAGSYKLLDTDTVMATIEITFTLVEINVQTQ